MAQRPKRRLLGQVRDAIWLRHYAYSTEKTYVYWPKRFTFYHDSSERTQDRQRIERIEQILFHIHPLHLLNPLMAVGRFSAESYHNKRYPQEMGEGQLKQHIAAVLLPMRCHPIQLFDHIRRQRRWLMIHHLLGLLSQTFLKALRSPLQPLSVDGAVEQL